jgi:mono/diheme cytochrome c family protein
MDSTFVKLIAGLIVMIANAALAAETPAPPDPALVKAGRAIYRHSCASCHGARGEGAAAWEIPDQLGELPAPPHDAKGHTWRHSDAMLYRVVQEGWRDEFNKTDRLTMPAFKGQLSRKETIAVIAYLKTLWTPKQRQFQREESRREPFPAEAP